MATVASKTITAEEFFDFVHRPENRDRRFELDQGEIVEMSRPGELHCAVCGNVTGLLWLYARNKNQGYVCPNDMGIVLERDPDKVKGPDVSFYVQSRKLEDLDRKYPDRLPDLAVEVLSPNDRFGTVVRRLSQFLAHGVKLVWLLDPNNRSVTVFRTGELPLVLEEKDELGGFDAVADFRCKVADFFLLPGESR